MYISIPTHGLHFKNGLQGVSPPDIDKKRRQKEQAARQGGFD
jgi:hypothetical protein